MIVVQRRTSDAKLESISFPECDSVTATAEGTLGVGVEFSDGKVRIDAIFAAHEWVSAQRVGADPSNK